jgi:type IV secretory pathway VirB9-like protein
MPQRSQTLCLGVLALLVGCAGQETYPPAVPTAEQAALRAEWKPPMNCYVEADDLKGMAMTALGPDRVPTPAEWVSWQIKDSTVTTCTGKGKKRRCKQGPVTAVDQANKAAVVKPTIANTQLGTSGRITYDYDPGGNKIYKVVTSPSEATWMTLPEGFRLAADLLLDTKMWEISYAKIGEEGHRQQLIAIRPKYTEMQTRSVLQLQSGAAIQLALESQERPGMLRVSWVLPELPKGPPPLTPDKIPPVFDNQVAYADYRLTVKSKGSGPAWMPQAVVDDGKVTMIRFPPGMDALRVPVASGIKQDGEPALVQTRLYHRPEHGYWLYVQGLWPAVELRDAAGVIVRAVRKEPPPASKEEKRYETNDTLRVDSPARLSVPARPNAGAVRH